MRWRTGCSGAGFAPLQWNPPACTGSSEWILPMCLVSARLQPEPSYARSAQMCPASEMLPPSRPGWDCARRTRSVAARCSIPRALVSGAALPLLSAWEHTRQGRSDGTAIGDVEEVEGQESNCRLREKAGISIPAPYGVLWRLKLAHQIWRKLFRIMVSALGLEPRTHALKGRCSTH